MVRACWRCWRCSLMSGWWVTHAISEWMNVNPRTSAHTQPREKGKMRFHMLQNVDTALSFLRRKQVKLVNIRPDDITDGNPKLTLGLIWTIILHFQVSIPLSADRFIAVETPKNRTSSSSAAARLCYNPKREIVSLSSFGLSWLLNSNRVNAIAVSHYKG